MAEMILIKLTKKGQVTIPQELRKSLKLEGGSYLALRPMLGGIFLSPATVEPIVSAEQVLRHLVISIGKAAAEQGITEDKDLDPIIEDIQQRIYEKHYGRS